MFVQFCAYLSQSGAKAIQQLCSCPVRIKNMALKCIEWDSLREWVLGGSLSASEWVFDISYSNPRKIEHKNYHYFGRCWLFYHLFGGNYQWNTRLLNGSHNWIDGRVPSYKNLRIHWYLCSFFNDPMPHSWVSNDSSPSNKHTSR